MKMETVTFKMWSVAALLAVAVPQVGADEEWKIAERKLPVPAGASKEIQSMIRELPTPNVEEAIAQTPTSDAQWIGARALRDESAKETAAKLAEALEVTYSKDTIAGVPVWRIKPGKVDRKHKRHVFVSLHGGAYVIGGGDATPLEGISTAATSKIEVIAIDYRMPPEHPFPCGLDDVVSVYQKLLETYPAKKIAIGGASAGGGLTLASVHKFKAMGLDLPGALFAGTPWSDLTKTGDSYFINEGIDHVLVTNDGFLGAAALLYAGGEDLKNPLLSPINGSFEGFPPTFLVSGTRDLFLSNTVRTHAKMRAAKVDADLMVFEGLSHAEYLPQRPDGGPVFKPEEKQAFTELSEFLLRYLK